MVKVRKAIAADGKTLTELTGIRHRTTLAKGITSLAEAGYIEKQQAADFAVSVYRLLNPTTREPLIPSANGTPLLYSNKLHYFTLPECCFIAKGTPSLFACLTPEQKRLYVVLAWLAVQYGENHFEVSSMQLQGLTGMKSRAVKSALDGLEEKKLASEQQFNPLFNKLHIHLYDPMSGRLLSEHKWVHPDCNERNWYETESDGTLRRADFKLTQEQTETLFGELLEDRGAYAILGTEDEFKFSCPFHDDSTPSCSFNTRKGCFYCFGCSTRGTTETLFTRLIGGDKRELFKRIASIKGFDVTLRNPDEGKTVYRYKDKFGRLRKEVTVCRDESGNKTFLQRVPSKASPDGWRYKTAGLAPMLFNLDLIPFASIVVIVEGEKDATTVTDLHIVGLGNLVIGTTSGGANSWTEKLAKDLDPQKHRVVILPDNDDAGTRYADAVEATLRKSGFDPRRLTLEGTGCKDVTEYVERYSPEDLAKLIGLDWIHSIDGKRLEEPHCKADSIGPYAFEQMLNEDDDVRILRMFH